MADQKNQCRLTKHTAFKAALSALAAAVLSGGDLLFAPEFFSEPCVWLFCSIMISMAFAACNLLNIGLTLKARGHNADCTSMAESYKKGGLEALLCFIAALLLPIVDAQIELHWSLRMFISAFCLIDLALIELDLVKSMLTLNSGIPQIVSSDRPQNMNKDRC